MSARPIRRVVTGHDPQGRATIVSDGPLPTVVELAAIPGTVFHEVWSTQGMPAPVGNGADPTPGPLRLPPPRRGNSDLMQRLYGSAIAQIMTGLILFTTFASLFAVLLGYSRVPYAAAIEGRFFQIFGRLHRTKNFPYFSVAFIGISSAFASLLNLSDLITALVVIQVLVQFMAQVVAVTLIRRYRPDIHRPFQMWFYPVTSIIAFGGWAFILAASGLKFILWGIALVAFGVIAYLWKARIEREWPFNPAPAAATP